MLRYFLVQYNMYKENLFKDALSGILYTIYS